MADKVSPAATVYSSAPEDADVPIDPEDPEDCGWVVGGAGSDVEAGGAGTAVTGGWGIWVVVCGAAGDGGTTAVSCFFWHAATASTIAIKTNRFMIFILP